MAQGVSATEFRLVDLPDSLSRIEADQDWDGLQALCDQHIFAVEGEVAATLFSVLAAVPESELAVRPRLMLAWVRAYYAHQPDDGDLRPFLSHYMELGIRLAARMDVERETSAATLVTVGVPAMIALRARGAYTEAEDLGRRLTLRAAQLRPLPGLGELARPGWLAMQRGLTRSLMADYPMAVELYRHAYEQALAEPDMAATALNAASNLAMVFAHLGHGPTARQWLDRTCGFEPPAKRLRFLLTAGAKIAEGWEALDHYDVAGVASRLETVGDAAAQLEVWPFVAALVVAHGLYFDDPAAALVLLGTLRLSHALVEEGAASRVMRRAHVDLLIATGQGTRALRVIKENGQHAPFLTLPTARLRLLNGEYEAVRALASRFSWDRTTSHRDLRQLLLLKAIAALRMGDEGVARDAARLANRLRTPSEVLSLASLPTADRADLLRLTDIPLTDEAAARLARARPVYPEHVDLVELTSREQTVLTELGEGGTLGEIAEKLVVSVNTVRTQVKSVYRKLRATSREDALMRAGELGLL